MQIVSASCCLFVYQSGGAHSVFVSVDRDYLQKNIKQLLRKDWKNRIKDTVFSPLELLRDMSELTEEATRVMGFSRATND